MNCNRIQLCKENVHINDEWSCNLTLWLEPGRTADERERQGAQRAQHSW